MKSQQKATSGIKWLEYHVANFRSVAAFSQSCAAIRQWAEAAKVEFEGVWGHLKKHPKGNGKCSTPKLSLPICCRFHGPNDNAATAYVMTHADFQAGDLAMASTKIVITDLKAGASANNGPAVSARELISRVSLDHECDWKGSTFPFHAQWGKNSAESPGVPVRWHEAIDEPRIPTFPFDVFFALEIVRTQLNEPSGHQENAARRWPDCLANRQWQDCLKVSTASLVDPWCTALRKSLKANHGLDAVRAITWKQLLEA